MIDLSGKTALVTGGSRGIGRATALLLARAGADVALTYRTRQAEAQGVAGQIRALGPLDIFVANAGTWPSANVPLARLTRERWRETMAANLDAVFLSTRAALGALRPGGQIGRAHV